MAGEDERHHLVIERGKELDHEHRRRFRRLSESGLVRVLSLRLVRQVLARLFVPPRQRPPRSVPHPPPGHIAVTFVGHASVMLTTNRTRLVVDPCFRQFLLGVRRREAACLGQGDAADTDLVLISHAHRDRLDPTALRRISQRATLVVPPRCLPLVQRLGFASAVELAPGQSLKRDDVEVTAVAARHDGRRGAIDRTWRSAVGYIVKSGEASVYYAGDTAYFSGFEEIGRRLQPNVALLPIAGYEPPSQRADHMSPLDALQAFYDLRAQLLVPVGYGSFPLGYEPMNEPLEWLARLCREHGLGERLVVLRPGDTCDVHGTRSATPQPSLAG